jgi:TolB-like protein/Flp pilus assembly protein TadD
LQNEVENFGPFSFDAENAGLSCGENFEALPPRACEVLRMLIKNEGRLVSKTDLEGVKHGGSVGYQIWFLRKTFARYGVKYKGHIETVSKKGYRFYRTLKPAPLTSGSQVDMLNGVETDSNKISLAVIPFTSEDEHLQDGIATAITEKLRDVQEIRVTPYKSSRRYYDKIQDPIDVGKMLGVTAILEGSVKTTTRRVRAAVKLIRVSDGAVIWSESFDEEIRHIYSLNSLIALKCAEQLTSNLSNEEKQRLSQESTNNAEAYTLYLDARKQWDLRSADGLEKAIRHFEDAVDLDPKFAAAFAGLANCYNLRSYYCGISPTDTFHQALKYSNVALQIDPKLPEAHASKAYAISRCFWNWNEAETEYKKAIALSPNYATAHQWYAEFLTAMGRFDEAIGEIKIAVHLDSHSPIINASLGTVLYFSRKVDEAIQQYRITIKEHPDFVRTHFRLARALVEKQEYGEAVSECKQGLRLSRHNRREIAQLGQVYAFAGQVDLAMNILSELGELSAQQYVSEYNTAIIYVGLGDRNLAFNMLEKAVWSRDPWIEHLTVDPRLDDLRDDKRFRDLAIRVGFPT